MKTLIVYYSRTGNNEKQAKLIAEKLDADSDKIIDLKNRRGVLRSIIAGFDAFLKRLTKIKYDKNPEKYDLVIIGGPIWSGTMAPAIRTYLKENKSILKNKNLAFFSIAGSRKEQKLFRDMGYLTTQPVSKLILSEKQFNSNQYKKDLDLFCKKFKKNKN